ncbi:hypothetical protein DFH06DRAFT_1246844 [Mycena polygramma]|nr:hypothetical protein DFH06DRAFT_1246844 [Mycena polygramma]
MTGFAGELVDCVIDNLKADKSALLVCSLVSKQWLPRSRLHGFSSVELTVARNPKDWKGPQRILAFLSLAESYIETFVPYVTTVHLSHQRERRKKRTQVITPEEILNRLDLCGIQPTYLTLDCLDHFTRPSSGSPAFSSSLLHLDLSIDENHVDLRSLVDYICAFPLLESIKVRGTPEAFSARRPKSSVLPPQLHTMHAGNPLLANWIATLNPTSKQIINLNLVDFGRSWFDWPSINPYFDTPAVEALESLTITGVKPGKCCIFCNSVA